MSRYTYQLERGEHLGTWQWQITAPDGTPYGWGARRGRKAECEQMLRRICRRLNNDLPPAWNNVDPEEAARSRRRGLRPGRGRVTL